MLVNSRFQLSILLFHKMIYAFIEMISFLNCNFKTINKNCYFTNQNRQNWLKLVSIIILIHMLIKFMTVKKVNLTRLVIHKE